MKINDLITGTVTGIKEYGIFLKFDNGYAGLLHISEASDYFVRDINEYAKIGDKLEVKIIGIDDENKKYNCSIKNTKLGDELDSKINHGFAPLKNKLDEWINEERKKNFEVK